MSAHETGAGAPRRPLRLWPGVAAAVLILLLRFVVPLVLPDTAGLGVIAGAAGGLVILLWWLLFSRAPWPERAGAIALMIAAAAATRLIVHPSIAGGMMGYMLYVMAIPSTLSLTFVGWAVAARHLSGTRRWVTMVAAIVLGCGVWTLARTEGVTGGGAAQLAWRWTPTPEQRLLAQQSQAPTAPAPQPVPAPRAAPAPTPSEEVPTAPGDVKAPDTTASPPPPAAPAARAPRWAGFRGAARDGSVSGVRLDTDWSAAPPVEVWRRKVGPGWSSFAVDGELVFTQEQRGEEEVVAAYRIATGAPVWTHRDPVRFYESNGGAGPRATPAVHGGRVYTMGATGVVNALDAGTGERIWSRNAETDTGATRPGWGFAGSPLVVGDAVIVAASGRLIAYDLATGDPRWTRTTGGGGYSSPHLATIDGVEQVLLASGGGVTGFSPGDGRVLWEHKGTGGVSILQPALVAGHDVLAAAGDMMGGTGIQRLALSRQAGTWFVQERWSSRGLKPYFSDFVEHSGFAFGFDGTILSCIDLETGERRWKGGRYGAGQMLLLRDQDLLLVLSEEGALALVRAAADQFTEVARFKAIEGKTWNHPVLAGDLLLVRNGEEMAAFRLPLAVR